jgi:hypothetical protein
MCWKKGCLYSSELIYFKSQKYEIGTIFVIYIYIYIYIHVLVFYWILFVYVPNILLPIAACTSYLFKIVV